MERLACAKNCPFRHRCGEGVKKNINLCTSEIKFVLGVTDFTVVDKYTVRGSALTSERMVPVGTVSMGSVEKIEQPEVLAPATV